MTETPLLTEVHWLQQNETDVPIDDEWLSKHEKTCLGGMRFAKRRADWRLGRWTAKCAVSAYWHLADDLAALADIEIRPAPSGAPEVFWRGEPVAVTISLSHRSGFSLCTLARAGVALGCDVEAVEPHSGAFISDYFTAEEQDLSAQTPAWQRWTMVALLWSAKESALKALHSGLRLDTRSVRVAVENVTFDGSGWQSLRVHQLDGAVFQGWWRNTRTLVQTLVADPAPSIPTLARNHFSKYVESQESEARTHTLKMEEHSLRC